MRDAASNKAREISLGDDFGDVAVNVNGTRIEVGRDGSVVAYTNGPVKEHRTAGSVPTVKAAVWHWLMQPMFGRR
jgi:hypothetical protein